MTDPIKAFQAGNMLRQSSIWVAGIVVARSTLSLQEIGTLEWLFFLAFMLSFFWYTGYIQYILQQGRGDISLINERFSRAIFIIQILSTIVCIPLILYGLFTNQREFLLFAFWILLSGVYGLLPYYYYLTNQTAFLNRFNLIYFVGYVLTFVVGILILNSIIALLYCLILFGVILWVWSYFSIKPSFRQRFDIPRPAFMLMGIALLGGLATLVDGVLVHLWYDDPSIFAIFRYGAREVPIAMILTASLGQAFIPLLVNKEQDVFTDFIKRSKRLMHYLFPIYILLLLGSDQLFLLFYGERFLESVLLFDMMLLIVSLRFLLPHILLIAFGHEKIVLKISFIELLINIGLSIYFIPIYGLAGIVLGTILSFVFEKLALVYLLYRKSGVSLRMYIPLKEYIIYISLIICLFTVKHLIFLFFN